MNSAQAPDRDWDDNEEGAPIDDEEESLASLVVHEITEYLERSGLVDETDLREIQPDLNKLARSIAGQVESHFGM
ncbi:hypothetical protein [Streptomyces sp. NPDC101455]|uniref:hypothetical protein n=1 Tax=Streptomyces sp. NPDC101455 TaxID=3366142 RepID=UPI00380F0894